MPLIIFHCFWDAVSHKILIFWRVLHFGVRNIHIECSIIQQRYQHHEISCICWAGCSLRWLCSLFAPTHYRKCKGIQWSCCLLWFGDLQTAASIPSSVLSVRVLIHCIHIICFWAASVLKTDSFTVECHSSSPSHYLIFPKIGYNHWF